MVLFAYKTMQPNVEQIIESIRNLPMPEQEKVWHWMDEERKPHSNGHDWSALAERFQRALRWIDENREEYLGKWVCLEGDKLISSGSDASEVYAEARSQGIKTPFIERIAEAQPLPFWGGWD